MRKAMHGEGKGKAGRGIERMENRVATIKYKRVYTFKLTLLLSPSGDDVPLAVVLLVAAWLPYATLFSCSSSSSASSSSSSSFSALTSN